MSSHLTFYSSYEPRAQRPHPLHLHRTHLIQLTGISAAPSRRANPKPKAKAGKKPSSPWSLSASPPTPWKPASPAGSSSPPNAPITARPRRRTWPGCFAGATEQLWRPARPGFDIPERGPWVVRRLTPPIPRTRCPAPLPGTRTSLRGLRPPPHHVVRSGCLRSASVR